MKSDTSWNPRWRLLACVAPAVAFFAAFWLLPVVRLLTLPADKGWSTYFAVLTDARYLTSMANTVALSVAGYTVHRTTYQMLKRNPGPFLALVASSLRQPFPPR